MTRHDTTRHDTSSCALRAVVVGSLQGVAHVLSSIHDSRKYVCRSAIVENHYGRNFLRCFFRSGLTKKIRLLLRIIRGYSSLRNHGRNLFRGIRVYFNSSDISEGLFELVPQKIFDDADIFLIACNDNTSLISEFKTSDYASGLMKRGISKDRIFVVPETMFPAEIPVIENESLSPLCRNLLNVRPVLRYFEYHVTDFCNLRCKGCDHFANKVNSLEFASVERFRLSLEKLKEKFSNVSVIRIMGGEPLLCRKLHEYINAAHELFPYSQIKIVSNGLLYKNITPETIETIKNSCTEIQVTQYPPTRRIASEIISFCENNGIKIYIGSPLKQFFRFTISGNDETIRKIWFVCESNYCHLLHDTKFFPCPRLWTHSYEKFKEFIKEGAFTESETSEYSYDLTKEIEEDGWDILMKFENPMTVCSKCGARKILFEWESEAGIE